MSGKFGLPVENPGNGPAQGYAMLAGAVLLSAVVIGIATGGIVAPAAFAGGVAALLTGGALVARARPVRPADEIAPPDWSVTVAAIDRPGEGVAIVDRANRLVCANRAYTDWFGMGIAPANLPLERPALEALARAAREAWREGSSVLARIESTDGTAAWRADVQRAGRGEDYLVWRFTGLAEADFVADFARSLGGRLGAVLSRSGIEAALVAPDGLVRAASAGFAHRAAGDPAATLAGQDFAGLLRTDDRDRIFFAREGRRSSPQTLLHVPLGELTQGQAPSADETPSLMLLVDAGVGLGGAGEPAGGAATPQLEALLGALPLGLAMTDRDGRFLFANLPFRRAAGIETALPQYPSDLVVREDKATLVDAVRRFGKGPASSTDVAVRLRGQPDDPVSLGIAGVRGLGEAAVLLSLVDSTEETRLKRQVAQATKMQAVGQLAGGVAHDFNNVLTAVIGTCDLMLLRHSPGDSDYDDINQIRANSNRAAALTRQLLAFSRQQTLRPEVLQLPDVVSEVSQLLKRLLGEKIELRVHHDRELGPVRADPQQLEQVIVNLAANARDAMHGQIARKGGEGGGKLSITTRRVTARDVRRMGSEILPEGEYTVLVVQDTGGGIPDHAIGKIFEPFFTTKEGRGGAMLGGTGLGLSTVYGIVKQSGGFIFADNIPASVGARAGARFSVYLPVHHGPVPTKAATALAAPAGEWSGGGRILLVEDEDMVRAVAERALTRAGYIVTACSDGEDGLAAIADGGEFDLVVSDVVMPGMDGPAMAKAIRQRHPQMPVLFMSGYAEEQLRRDIDIPDMHFIPKPFSVQEISDKVGAVLAARRA